MTTDVDVCNLALARLGDARISSLSDGSAQATYCNLLYSHTLEELQTDYAWAFCRKLATLSSTTAPAFGYTAAYTLPADFLRLLRVNGIDKQENFGQWEVVGAVLHTSLPASIQADYLANVTTVTLFPALFVELLSLKLAANLAMPLTGSKELFGQIVEAFAASLQRPAVQELILSNARARTTNSITTQADIVRLAILKTGTAEGYKPEAQPALLATSFYDQARNELLAEFNWAFARKAATATADAADPIAGYAKRYALPAGALNILRVNEVDSSENFGVWEVYGQFIHTDATGTITVEFTDTVSTISQFPPVFIDLLVNKIASRLAIANGDSGRMEILAKEAEIVYAKPAFAKAIESSAGARSSNAVASQSDICKQAVMRLGSTGALSQTGGQPAIFAHSFYDHTLEELLAELPWAFAKKQVSIASNATAPTQGYAKRYALPADFIQLQRVNQIDTTENFGQFEIIGGFIHTDLGSPIIIDYTANITDVSSFPAPFVEALIARLSAKIALPLTGKADVTNAMVAAAAESLTRPTVQILIEKSAKPRTGSPANTVAEISRQAILRVGSADIFKPFGEPMVIAQSLYEQTRNELLSDFDWQFARAQASVASTTAPSFGYTTRYALPANTLKILRVNGVDEDENFGLWEIVAGHIHTNYATPIQLEYTTIVTDVTKFPPVFTELLTIRLAIRLSQMVGDAPRAELLYKELELAISKPSLKTAVENRAVPRTAPSMSVDELCRQAILRLGTAEQFGSSTQAQLLAQSLYPQVRDSLLLTGSWTWAMKSTTLTADTLAPEFKWDNRFALPSDCLRVFRVDDTIAESNEEDWEVAGDYLLTDATSTAPDWTTGRSYAVGNAVTLSGTVYRCLTAHTAGTFATDLAAARWAVWTGDVLAIEYVSKITDTTKFDSLFIDLLTANLAAKLAIPVTGDAQKSQLYAAEAESLLKNPAMRRDSTERRSRVRPAWLNSRLVAQRHAGGIP